MEKTARNSICERETAVRASTLSGSRASHVIQSHFRRDVLLPLWPFFCALFNAVVFAHSIKDDYIKKETKWARDSAQMSRFVSKNDPQIDKLGIRRVCTPSAETRLPPSPFDPTDRQGHAVRPAPPLV